MYIIQQLTTNPTQKQNLILPDGSVVSLTITFYPLQYGWFITSLTYKTFTLTGLRITTSPNMLHQFLNQIPFGLACYVTGNREPTQIQDFASGAAVLYILSQAECAQYARILAGATS